VHKKCHFEIKS